MLAFSWWRKPSTEWQGEDCQEAHAERHQVNCEELKGGLNGNRGESISPGDAATDRIVDGSGGARVRARLADAFRMLAPTLMETFAAPPAPAVAMDDCGEGGKQETPAMMSRAQVMLATT
ncbi:hypothetical protein [Sphingomonas sp. PB4P5]|uniref:hypothetical protein n=1 Tax=Parasphingomonas puruogangriensis TaxID=3096155 RepID=UPI002FC8E466